MTKICCLLVVLILQASCLRSEFVSRDDFEQRMTGFHEVINKQLGFISYLACPMSIRQTLQELESTCKAAEKEVLPGEICSTDKIGNAIENFQDRSRRNIMAELLTMQHQVVYLSKNSTDVLAMRKGAITRWIREIPRFDGTKFMIATSTKTGPAETSARVEVARKLLLNLGIHDSALIRPLTYNFFPDKADRVATPRLTLADLRREDQPKPETMEQGLDIHRAVFFIRLDCF